MMSLALIEELNREAGDKARTEDIHPYLIKTLTQINNMPPFPFPFVGDAAEDFDIRYGERITNLFCDSSGMGAEDEPALTVNQLVEKLKELFFANHEELRVAIVEHGQFQLYLGVWK